MNDAVATSRVLESKPYVRIDEHGVYRIGNKRAMLDSVVFGFQAGDSPEEIRRQYPSLSLEEIYGSIAYYLGHREEVDAYLKRQQELWEKHRKESGQDWCPLVQRLRAVKAQIEKSGMSVEQWFALNSCKADHLVDGLQQSADN
jgi:uncharacterized protein (DUF433 family)